MAFIQLKQTGIIAPSPGAGGAIGGVLTSNLEIPG